jgi:hypothetical protein
LFIDEIEQMHPVLKTHVYILVAEVSTEGEIEVGQLCVNTSTGKEMGLRRVIEWDFRLECEATA